MAGPHTVSPLLVELRRLIFAQEAATVLPTPMIDALVWNLGDDSVPVTSMVDLHQEIIATIAEASDSALFAAYQQASGVGDELEAETLLAEIRVRTH
jgi:hypothetical protein